MLPLLQTWDNMLAHPPWDTKEVNAKGQPFYLLHLTYPLRYNSSGVLPASLHNVSSPASRHHYQVLHVPWSWLLQAIRIQCLSSTGVLSYCSGCGMW